MLKFPDNISDFIDERISFCESWLKSNKSTATDERMRIFISAVNTLHDMKRLLFCIEAETDNPKLNLEETKRIFALGMTSFLIGTINEQLKSIEGIPEDHIATKETHVIIMQGLCNIYNNVCELTGYKVSMEIFYRLEQKYSNGQN